MTAYEEIRGEVRTGDIVLFAGKGPISNVIKHLTRSRWSHIGMAYRPSPDLVLLWESTTLSTVAGRTNGWTTSEPLRPVSGLQLVELSRRLVTYDGATAYRRLIWPTDRAYALAAAKFEVARIELARRPYEQHKVDLLMTLLPRFLNREEDLASLFCSEAVAEAWQRMGLIPEELPSDSFQPVDWSEDADDDEASPCRLAAEAGARLGAMIYLR